MTSNQTNQLYTPRFFQFCVAVVLFMTGLALQFHFGQYVEFLGHGVDTLGRILSIGMIGTLAIRLHIGRWIDRFGCRPTWICGALIVALCVGSVQFVEQLWLLTLLRAASTMASAAVMTTVAVFAALTAPPHRRAESIGTIGMAGFVGMIAGPTLGDWIFAGGGESITPYRIFFSASALCSLLACGVVGLIAMPTTAESAMPPSSNAVRPVAGRSSQVRIIRDHWPGMILLIGVVFSMAFCLQSMFLERLAEARGFRDIKLFFLAYGPTAMVLRVVFRRLPERLGRSRTLVLGMLLLAIGQLTLRNVHVPYQLLLPGILMGAGHSFIFPSMVDLAAERLPLAFRGTGTSMILGAGDVGMLIGFAGLGGIINAYGFDTALTVLASTVFGAAAIFAITRPKKIFLRTR